MPLGRRPAGTIARRPGRNYDPGVRAMLTLAVVVGVFLWPGNASAEVLRTNRSRELALATQSRSESGFRPTTDDRNYRVEVFDPSGRSVLARAGEATPQWQIWNYLPRRTGVFRTVYDIASGSSTFETRVNAGGCFSGNVAGAASGPGHRFVVGDGLYLNFRDNASYDTPYRACWQRVNGGGVRCWSRRTSATTHLGRIFTPAPQRSSRYVVRWYVRGRLVATWKFQNGVGD